MGDLRELSVRPGTTASGVRTWLVDLDPGPEVVAVAETLLSSDERRRARRGTPVVHRRRVLLRAALRTVLAEHGGLHPTEVVLRITEHGRPTVAGLPYLDANCSASGDLGLVALGNGRRVGVDVERVAPWSASVLAEGWLRPDEQEALRRLGERDAALAAARSWTRKEAVLKARGTGLLEHPSTVRTRIGRTGGTVAGWVVDDLLVPHGWVASLASRPLIHAAA